MNEATLRAYDATRDFSDKSFKAVCYAPFISLYFDTLGFVRVCCQNTMHTVGNMMENTLDEIWNGPKIKALREALINYDFKLGCRFCEWQLGDGDYQTSFMRTFDEFPVLSTEPQWPVRMEFSVSNTCNLECVMCNGEWSSSVRSRREKLPPLPKAYSEQFFQDLRRYLPHLKTAKFLGGEPFLAQESLRIWNMMVDDGLDIKCHVTTNGTQYNDKVERILNHLPVSFSISMDGFTKKTVESIRVNAIHEVLLENFKKFHAYARSRGTYIGLTYCLMQKNWHEFGDYLLFADEWDVQVVVNTVIQPLSLSLHVLPPDELREVVECLERQDAHLRSRLGKNRQVWIDQLTRLRQRLEVNPAENLYFVPLRLTENFQESTAPAAPRRAEMMTERQARRRLERWVRGAEIDGWVTNRDGVVIETLSGGEYLLGVPTEKLVGKPAARINIEFLKLYGEKMDVLHEDQRPHFTDRLVALTLPNKEKTFIRTINFPRYDAFDEIDGSITLAAISETEPVERVHLADLFTDLSEGTGALPVMTERLARRRLASWTGSNVVDGLICDSFDVVVGLYDDRPEFLGIPASACLGKTIDQLVGEFVARHGESIVPLREAQEAGFVDRILQVTGDGKPATHVRSITFPQYDDTGLVAGTTTLAVASSELPEERVRQADQFAGAGELGDPRDWMTEEKATSLLRQWCWTAPVGLIRCDFQDVVLDASNTFLGVPREQMVGKRVDECLASLIAKHGPVVKTVREARTPQCLDRTVEFSGPDRPAVLVRSLTIPVHDAAGEVVGTVALGALATDRQLAGARIVWGVGSEARTADSMSLTPREGRLLCRTWNGRGEVARVTVDDEGAVSGIDGASENFLVLPSSECLGRPIAEVLALAKDRAGAEIRLVKENCQPGFADRLYSFALPGVEPRYLRLLSMSEDGKNKQLFAALGDHLPDDRNRMGDSFDDRAEFIEFASRDWLQESDVRSMFQEWRADVEVHCIACDLEDRVLSCEGERGDFLGIESRRCVGLHTDDIFAELRQRLGENVRLDNEAKSPRCVDRQVSFIDGEGSLTLVRSVTIPIHDDAGRLIGTRTWAALSAGPIPADEMSLSGT
ncbi:MAG: radical SAM protein [Planctomycetota bacterium]